MIRVMKCCQEWQRLAINKLYNKLNMKVVYAIFQYQLWNEKLFGCCFYILLNLYCNCFAPLRWQGFHIKLMQNGTRFYKFKMGYPIQWAPSVFRYIVFLRYFNLPILPVLTLKKYRHINFFRYCRLFVDIENVYRNNFHKICYNYTF